MVQALTLQAASLLRTTLPTSKFDPVGSYKGFYTVLRKRVMAWAETRTGSNNPWMRYVLLAPDFFHLVTCLLVDPDVPAKHKAALGGVVAYFILPIDLLPEALLGPVGYLDDVALAAYAVNQLVNDVDPEVVARNWAGDGDALQLASELVQKADEYIGSGLFNKLRKMLMKDLV